MASASAAILIKETFGEGPRVANQDDVQALYEALQITLTVIHLYPEAARGLTGATKPNVFERAAVAFENLGKDGAAESIRGWFAL